MSAETTTYTALSTHAGLVALVSTRIYPLMLPQDCPLPAVTYQLISDVPTVNLDGDADLSNARVQVDVWATSYGGAATAAAQVMLAMDTIAQCTPLSKPIPMMDDETGEHRRTMDFSVWSTS